MAKNIKLFIFVFLSLLFPGGIWLGLEGYELWSLVFLIFGWVPVTTVIVVQLYGEGYI